MRKNGWKSLLMMSVAWGAASRCLAAEAEGSSPAVAVAVDELVVTAQKREQSLQKVPLAVTALAGAVLRAQGVNTVDGLTSSVPSLQLGQTYGQANVTLRGIGLNAVNWGVEGSIAFHLDGVYVGRPAAALNDFYDVQRLEVLRGPQGTLYGRNATGGAVNIITADPSPEAGGYVQVTGGEYHHIATEGALGGPLIPGSDSVLYRFSFHTDSHSGYGKNEITGTQIDDLNNRGARLKVELRPSDRLRANFAADYSHQDDRQTSHYGGTPLGTPPWGVEIPVAPSLGGGVLVLGGRTPRDVRDIASDVDPIHRATFWGVSANVTYDFDDVQLRSITAFRRSDIRTVGDLDQTSFDLASRVRIEDHAKQFSQELQLTQKTGRLDWLAGAFFFHETDNGHNPITWNSIILNTFGVAVPPPGLVAQGYYDGDQIKTDAGAIFGQLTYRATDNLSLTVGGRFSVERKAAINRGAFDLTTPYDPAVGLIKPSVAAGTLQLQCGSGQPTIGFAPGVCVPDKTWSAFTPKVGLEYSLSEHTLAYVSYSDGFKSGAYNLGAAQRPANPEKVTDYEGGIKSTLFDGRFRANIAAFYYDYRDLQVNKAVTTFALLENAASAKIYGLEYEFVARPWPQFQLDGNASHLHTRFDRFISADAARPAGDGHAVDNYHQPAFDLAGNTLPQAPTFSGRLGASVFHETSYGEFTLRGEVTYVSRVYLTAFNLASEAVSPRTRFNASIGFNSADKNWTVSLVAKNLGDKVKLTNGLVGSAVIGSPINGYIEAPRTIDLTIEHAF